jgi:TonB family protein
MSATRIGRGLVLILGFAAGVHIAAANDDTLDRAKNLYASAAYDEALAVLDHLDTTVPPEDPMSIAEYRALCLLALDRRDEARKSIDRILHERPLYMPSIDQVSPRIQSIFRDVRRQTLPAIVMERYAAAKGAYERKDSAAAQQFDDLVKLLDDPDLQDASALRDLRSVALAFRDLANAVSAASAAAAPARSAPAAPAPPAEPPDVIYTPSDSDVTPPLALSQVAPVWHPASPMEARQEYKGTLRLVIDKSGAVVSATMVVGTRPAYDQALLRAAREWKFRPAQKQGRPVRYVKVVDILLKASAP